MHGVILRKLSLVAVVLLVVPRITFAGVFIDELRAASDAKKGAMCAPWLRKTVAIVSPSGPRDIPQVDDDRRRFANNLFQISYRAIGLDRFGKKTAPDLIDRAWQTTADDLDLGNGETRYTMVKECIAVYERLRKSGYITKADEEISLKLAKEEVSEMLRNR